MGRRQAGGREIVPDAGARAARPAAGRRRPPASAPTIMRDSRLAPGLLCIGDAAHAMSPVGGVGINLAIQDAVAAANVLAEPLRKRLLTVTDLQRIQERREFPTRVTQSLQVAIQRRVIAPVLGAATQLKPPLLLRMIASVSWLRRIPAYIVGVGVRPEHIRTPEIRDAR